MRGRHRCVAEVCDRGVANHSYAHSQVWRLCYTSRITGMMSGRRDVSLFRNRFKSERIFSCITPQSLALLWG